MLKFLSNLRRWPNLGLLLKHCEYQRRRAEFDRPCQETVSQLFFGLYLVSVWNFFFIFISFLLTIFKKVIKGKNLCVSKTRSLRSSGVRFPSIDIEVSPGVSPNSICCCRAPKVTKIASAFTSWTVKTPGLGLKNRPDWSVFQSLEYLQGPYRCQPPLTRAQALPVIIIYKHTIQEISS